MIHIGASGLNAGMYYILILGDLKMQSQELQISK